MDDFNTGENRPGNSIFKNKSFIIILVVLILGAIAIFYLTQNTISEKPASSVTPAATQTAVALPIVSDSGASSALAISPLSPVPASPNLSLPDADTLDTLFQTGVGYYEAREFDKALATFDEMLALDPLSARAFDARGTIHTSLGNIEQALADYDQAIKIDSLYPPAYFNRGRLHSLQKNYEPALADLQKSIELAPLFFGYRANGNIGLIYHQQGEYDKAVEAFSNAILLFDDSKADTYYLRGETYTAMNNYEAAISDYEAAISRFPDYYQAYQSLGYARYKTGQFDQATEALNKAVQLSSNTPAAHFYLALVYLAGNQADKATTEVSQAVETVGALGQDEQSALFQRVLADLDTFVAENPEQAKNVEKVINLIPQP